MTIKSTYANQKDHDEERGDRRQVGGVAVDPIDSALKQF